MTKAPNFLPLASALAAFSWVIAITNSFAAPANSAARPAASAPITAWRLKQMSGAWGHCTVYISSKAVRIDAPDLNFYLISKAPLWNFEIVNNQKKKSFVCDTGSNCFAIHRLATGLGHIKDYKEEKSTFQNQPATLFTSTEARRSEHILSFNNFERKNKKQFVARTNYTVLPCKNTPAPAALLLGQFYDMPRGSLDVPVTLYTLRDGEKLYRLQTAEIKLVNVDPAFFTAKKYPKATRPEELLVAPTADVSEEMLNDAGFY